MRDALAIDFAAEPWIAAGVDAALWARKVTWITLFPHSGGDASEPDQLFTTRAEHAGEQNERTRLAGVATRRIERIAIDHWWGRAGITYGRHVRSLDIGSVGRGWLVLDHDVDGGIRRSVGDAIAVGGPTTSNETERHRAQPEIRAEHARQRARHVPAPDGLETRLSVPTPYTFITAKRAFRVRYAQRS
jgi:hypothetical protein